jgi:hypothetical protein
MRLILIALNTALALGGGLTFTAFGVGMSALDVVGVAVVVVMLVLLVARSLRNLRELAQLEPASSRS